MLDSSKYGVFVELEDEEGREIEAEWDIILCGKVADSLHNFIIRVDEEASRVKEAGSFEDINIAVEVFDAKVACSGDMGAERPLTVLDDGGTLTRHRFRADFKLA